MKGIPVTDLGNTQSRIWIAGDVLCASAWRAYKRLASRLSTTIVQISSCDNPKALNGATFTFGLPLDKLWFICNGRRPS